MKLFENLITLVLMGFCVGHNPVYNVIEADP
jgi:hypothetical protein